MILSVLIASTILSFALPASVAFADASFSTYKELFAPGSGITNISISVDSTKKTISSIDFNIKWAFPVTTDKNAEWYWNHIPQKDTTTDAFLIRQCAPDTAGNPDPATCVVSPVPYYNVLNDSLYATYGKTSFFREGPDGKFSQGTGTGTIKVPIVNFFNSTDSTRAVSVSKLELNGATNTYDLWYCATDTGDANTPINAYTENGGRDPLINQFTGFCGGHSFFKIGGTVTKTRPSSFEQAALEQAQAPTPTGTTLQNTNDKFPACHLLNGEGPGEGSLVGCLAYIVYFGLFIPASAFAWLMGQLFDFFIGFSINDEAYRFGFLTSSWQLVRDISNIFFIVILIYTALSAVFGFAKVNYKNVVVQLIINALLINFSLFGVRLLVDMSNIVGRLFYNNVQVQDVSSDTSKVGATGYTPISESIISAFNPQKIFDASSLNKDASTNVGTSVTEKQNDAFITATESKIKSPSQDVNSTEYASYYSLISLAAAILVLMVGIMFWNVTFMFLGRVLGIWVSMMLAPFAIMSRDMPMGLDKFKMIGWEEWKKNLLNYILLAPTFLLFLYLVNALLKPIFSNLVKVQGTGFFATLLSIVIPMVMIFFMLKKGEGIAKKFSGEMGDWVQGMAWKAGSVVGAGIGLTAGGIGLAGRGAASMVGKTGLASWAAENSKDSRLARTLNKGIKWSQTSSMDLRNTKLGSGLTKGLDKLGAKPEYSITDKIGLGQNQYKGGVLAIQKKHKEDKEKEVTNKLKFDHLSDEQAKKAWSDYVAKTITKNAKEKWIENRTSKISELNPSLKPLKDQETFLRAEIEKNKTAGNVAEVKRNEEALKSNIQRQEAIEKAALKQTKEEAKTGAYTDSQEYKTFLADQEKGIKKVHGDIKNGKELSNAMRYEYTKKLQESSLHIKNGQKRKGRANAGGIAALVAGSTLGSVFPLAGPLVENWIDSKQQAAKEVFEKIVKDYEKNKGKGTKVAQLEGKLREYNKIVDDNLKKVLAEMSGDPNIKPEDIDLSKIALVDDEKKSHISAARANAQAEFNISTKAYEKSLEEYMKKGSSATKADKDELVKKSTAKQKAEDEWNNLKDVWKNLETAEKDLNEAKDKEKDAANKKKDDTKDEKGK